MQLIEGRRCATRRSDPPRRARGSFCGDDAQINTPTVVAALAAGARVEGADVREGVSVRCLLPTASASSASRRPTNVSTPTRLSSPPVRGRGSCSPPPARTCRSGSNDCRCWRRSRDRSTSSPWSTGRWQPSSTRCSANAVVGRVGVPAPHEIETAGGCSSSVATSQRGDVARLSDGLPDDVSHEVTLSGLLATAQAITDDFPGLRDGEIDRMWAGVCRSRPNWCRSSTRSSLGSSSRPAMSSGTPPGR